MIFHPTRIAGAYVLDLQKIEDHRGFFARAWCEREFEQQGLVTRMVQTNVALTRQRGTVRGLHYQREPYGEAKLVRCTRGAVFDVIVDLRPESPSYTCWLGVELSAASYQLLYFPAGCAHGYQALEDDSELTYSASQFYTPQAEGGVRYNDPAFAITWPLDVTVISEKDAAWPDFGA